ncbi:MAG: ABC1 kinase family protein [Bacteroidia bacterium]
MLFNQTFKNLRRTREIIRILLKYGFEDVVTETSLQNMVSEKTKLTWYRSEKPVFEYTRWERIRMATEELGPTFVKFAQVVSNRPDILPAALIHEFEKLQSSVAPFDTTLAKQIIEKELNIKIEEFFEYFGETPIGSASIGQVHLARLSNGEQVVVKIQRPNVKEQIDTDLSIMKDLALRTEKFLESVGVINVMDVVKAFERSMLKELDYNHEARNIEQFRKYYAENTDFYVPKAYRQYTTERVMVIEMVSGTKITNVEQLTAWGVNPDDVAKLGMKIYLNQIFEHGYFHADPHPGNVLVRPDGSICLIDFGMVGSLMEEDKQNFAGIFISMAQKDARAAATYLRRLSIDDEIKDVKQLEYEVSEIIEDFAALDVKESNMAVFGARLQSLIYEHRMRVPGSIFLILRALAILEGIGKVLSPDFNTMEFMKPYGMKLIRDKFSPNKLGRDLYNDTGELIYFLQSLPIEIHDILKQTRKGRLRIQLEHKEYEPILDKVTRTINRLTLSIVISALFISASLALFAPQLPRSSTGIPYLSIVGYLGALFGCFILWVVSVRSARKM